MSAIRAIGLISGGLDSTLAARLMLDQGIEVIGVNFNTGFCLTDTRRQVQRRHDLVNLRNEALRTGSDLNIPIEIVDVSKDYLDLVTHPRWGYGKNANPCIDCRIMMLRKAKEMLLVFAAQFVFTGEVLAQRPMTQFRATLRQIEKQSDLTGFLLRPLSALKLPETEVEKRGWIQRAQLKGIAGRSRKPQIQLAAELGIKDYPQPAGGCCFLTDPAFGRKFFDYLRHKPESQAVCLEDFLILKIGRHLRLAEHLKLVVGRDEAENNFLENYVPGRWTLRPVAVMGPLALLEGEVSNGDLEFAAQVVARYSDGRDQPVVDIICEKGELQKQLQVAPLARDAVVGYLIY